MSPHTSERILAMLEWIESAGKMTKQQRWTTIKDFSLDEVAWIRRRLLAFEKSFEAAKALN